MRRAMTILLACLAVPAAAAPDLPATAALAHPLAGVIVETATGRRVTPADLAEALRRADVSALGEIHDNPEHHAAQAWLVAEIAPAGLAFEMIPRSMEGMLARLRAEDAPLSVVGAALAWEARGWPDWDMYAPILAAAPLAPVTGADLGPEATAAAMREGAAAAARGLGAAARLYRLDRPLAPDAQAAAVREQVAAHCDAIPSDVAGRMVEAQRLRDAALADAALRARALGDDGPVALIAGAGHTRIDRGAPYFLNAARPDLTVVALALMEVSDGAEDWPAYAGEPPAHDYLWFTAPAPREDPCAAFLRRRG